MRMSSAAVKKGDKGKPSSASHPVSKENATQSSNKISTSTKPAPEAAKPAELNPKLLPTAEQLRIAQMISDSKRDDPELPEKVNKLVELTNCSPDAAIIALHDSNNDLDSAIVALLDGETEGDWEVSGKKKKPKQPAQAPAEGGELEKGAGSGRGRDRARGGRGGPPRLRGRGRGRDNKENVEDDSEAMNGSRGRGPRGGHRSINGPGREGSRGGRGGRGGYRGGRSRGPPPSAENDEGNEYPALGKVESWNNDFPQADDWDNEEYIGSLAETKVFTPSQSTSAPVAPAPVEPLPNGSTVTPATVEATPAPVNTSQVHYSTNNAQQGIDLNALLQKTSGVTVVSSALQPPFLPYGQQDSLKAAMMGPKSAKPLRPKIPSKIPSSAVEMPDDPAVSGLDVKFGTLDFGIEPSGFEISLEGPTTSTSVKTDKMEFGGSAAAQPPAASSLPKPDASLGGFGATSAQQSQQQQQQSVGGQAKASGSATYAYGASYAQQTGGVSSAPAQTTTAQPAGAYPSNSQTSAGGVYSNSGSSSTTYQGASSQTGYGAYGQQQSQQQPAQTSQAAASQQQQQTSQQQQPSTSTSYPAYNKIATSTGLADSSNVSNLRDLPSTTASSSTSRAPATASTTTATANKPATTATLAAGGSGLPNMPPGVPLLGPGSFIMGQGPTLPYYAAAAAAAGMQQHPIYSLEEMQYRYPHLAAGYYDMGYQSPTSLGTAREGLASLAYAGSDASKFSRNENNSPVPTSLSQNVAQSHGGAFITPAAAAPTPLPATYAYYYSGGVMPGGFQYGAPLYPVSAAASGHAGSGAAAAAQYGKGGPLGATATAAAPSAQTTAAGPTNATASGYASYGSTDYDGFKSMYNAVGSAGAQAAKMGGVGASSGPSSAAGSGDLGVGPNVYGKTHNQLGKINTYDKAGGFHTGTPPPYGLAGNAAPLGVGVNVGVGGPSPYGAQQMFIPTLAPHQSQHSHLMHQQLHQDSNTGAGQRTQSGGQQNKQGSKPSYGGSYWASN